MHANILKAALAAVVVLLPVRSEAQTPSSEKRERWRCAF
jgi:hypothetical protein